jgi:hypothetical protein
MRLARILPLLALAACAGRPARENDISSSCPGQRSVVVTNSWNRTVDIYTSGDRIIGSVRPGGREELLLPDNATYAYARATPRVGNWQTPNSRVVRFRYLCR